MFTVMKNALFFPIIKKKGIKGREKFERERDFYVLEIETQHVNALSRISIGC